jgi:inner membrane protein
MSTFGALSEIKTRSRSMGVKLVVICLLALLMTIPGWFVQSLVDERSKHAGDVTKQVSDEAGGQQTFLGPTLAIPYTIPATEPNRDPIEGVYLVFPARAAASVASATQQRKRGMIEVPVFEADLKLDGDFDLTGVPAAAPQGAVLDWSRAEFVVGVSDPRGALGDGQLAIDGKSATLLPAKVLSDLKIGMDQQDQPLTLTLFGVKAGDDVKPNAQVKVTSASRFGGAQRLAVLAYGQSTHLVAQGDWRTPSFDGGFLPVHQQTSDAGFSAEWSVPYIARGVLAEGSADTMMRLGPTALTVYFTQLVDPYHSVDRALKYILLFEGLIFLTYFIFEATQGKRLHPAQYILVGVAQIIFYLLLLSLAEHIGFDPAFLIAGAATVLLLSVNASWIFVSRLQGFRALVVFSLLYSLIYMLLRLEDNALLVGAIASFMAIAAAMYFTRSVNWYSAVEPQRRDDGEQGSAIPKVTLS